MTTAPDKTTAHRPPTMKDLLAGFLVACAVAWIAGAIFLDHVPPTVPDQATGLQVYPEGSPIQYRTEGWATSYSDAHGMNHGGGKALASGHPVVIWGDSHVQALQVADNIKMNSVLTALCAESGRDCAGVGIGWFADAIADYYFKIKRYGELIDNTATHVILLGQILDIVPDTQEPCRDGFLKTGEGYTFHQEQCPPKKRYRKVASLLYDLHLAWASSTLSLLRSASLEILAPIPTPFSQQAEQPPPPPIEAWEFMLNAFTELTGSRLMFVYVPEIPRMTSQGLSLDDPNRNMVNAFQALCAARGIPFINMQKPFADLYMEEHRFPRGFSDTLPWKGHLNEAGHRLIAQALFQHLMERQLP